MSRTVIYSALAVLMASGCALVTPSETPYAVERPDGAAPGTCWAKQIRPAVIETAQTQSVLTGDEGETIYQTTTSQTIIEERQEVWFEVPCRNVMTQDFIKTLQRALKARGLYQGPITGVVDQRTSKAIGLFQRPLGVDSQVLSIIGAQALGLVASNF